MSARAKISAKGTFEYRMGADMAEGQEAPAQNPPTTIWNQLDVWAQGFKPWQRFVLAHAIRFGRLTDEQIDQAYSLFLTDNNLGEAPDPPV